MTVAEPAVDHGRALLYHQSRPPYPAAVVDFVVEHTEPRALAVVADVGCGTGLSTLPFRRLAGTLIGIEPDPAMRTVAEETLTVHGVTVLSGSAEQTGLPDNSVNLIVAASCSEWFNHRQAAIEWRRILVPDGRVLLMWNHRVAIDSITRAWDRLWARHMGPRLGPDIDDIDYMLIPRFPGPRFHRFSRVEHHHFDEAGLLRFALSSGYAPRPSQDRRRHALMEAITTFHTTHCSEGVVPLAFQTVAYLVAPG
jgi:SAM-dependent methyltransferase